MTFEEMSFKEKWEHIWEYYKFHMAVVGGIFLLVGSLLNIYLINPAPDVILDVTLRMTGYNYDYEPILKAELESLLIPQGANQTVVLDFLDTSDNLDPSIVMANEAKFMGKTEVQDLDIVVMDDPNFRYLLQNGFFTQIQPLLDTYGNGVIPEDAKIYTTDPATQENVLLVFDAHQFPKLSKIIADDENPYYVGIFTYHKHPENIIKALEYMAME